MDAQNPEPAEIDPTCDQAQLDVVLGRRLRWRRKALSLSQATLATAVGLRFQQIHKYECAANRMSASVIWRLARALEVEVDYFFEGAAPG